VAMVRRCFQYVYAAVARSVCDW